MGLKRFQVFSLFIGNLFEHYDTALFGLLSPFLAPALFPYQDPISALIFTYALIPLGMLARPLGSLLFGYIGDQYGRKQALFGALVGMACVSGCMAACPPFQTLGSLAPLLFFLGRVMQNFFAAGENMGGAICLLEQTDDGQQDLMSSFYSASTIGGILLAAAGVSLLCSLGILEEGWRLLYVVGCMTGCVGVVLRRQVPELKIKEISYPFSGAKLFSTFWIHRKALLQIALAAGFSYASYSVALVMINGFLPLISSVTQEQMAQLTTGFLVFDFCALPFFGFVAQKFSRQKVMAAAALSAAIGGVPLFILMEGGSFITILLVRLCLVLIGMGFSAPFHAWSQKLVPATDRYIVISLGYALGSQIIGAPTSAISLWFYGQTGSVASAGIYWVALALISTVVLVRQRFQLNSETAVRQVSHQIGVK